ncbi:MAG: CvpA family protein [Mariniblastus sp.]|nr:CvpA family protein [Mariniblastus sp.]
MSFYDMLMIAILSLTILFGLWKGLAWQIASLAAIIVSYIVAMQFRGDVSPYIQAEEPWNRFAAMLILYVGTWIAIWIIYALLVRKTIDGLKLSWFDRPAGALAGAAKGAILCMVITMFSVALLGEAARDAIISSKSGGYITAAINRLDQWMPTEIHAYIDPYVNRFNHKMTEKDPNWIQNSEDKFSSTINQIKGNLSTFHGNWNQPSNADKQGAGGANPQGGMTPQPASARTGR